MSTETVRFDDALEARAPMSTKDTKIVQLLDEITEQVDACQDDDDRDDYSPRAQRRTAKLRALRAELKALVAS
jgi:hypothetical protein